MNYNDGARQVKLHPWKKEVHVLHMKQINLMKDFVYLKDFFYHFSTRKQMAGIGRKFKVQTL